MPNVDLTTLGKQNMWRTPHGELCTRPGLRQVLLPDSGRELCAGFTVVNDRNGERFHYLWDVASLGLPNTPTARDVRVRVYDEDFGIFQEIKYHLDVVPRGVSYARVLDQLLVGSPDLPTLWSLVGGALIPALPKPSISGEDPIDVPRGIWCSWQNRPVACNGADMFVGDPVNVQGGDLRSFVGSNQNQRPGGVYGIHEGAGGMLLAATSVGVYGLDASAASVGVVGSDGSDWRVLSHAPSLEYDSSAVVRGRLYLCSRDGILLGDVEDGPEVALSDPAIPRALGVPVASDDFRRAGRLMAMEEGPAVALHDEDALWRSDKRTGMASWWTGFEGAGDFRVCGTLRDVDGAQLLVTAAGVLRACGDFDGGQLLSSGRADQPTGSLYARADLPDGADSAIVRRVRVRSTSTTVKVAVRGRADTALTPVDADGLTAGVDSWGDKRWTATPVGSVEFPMGENDAAACPEPSFEVGALGCAQRVGPPDVEVGGAEDRAQRTG